jgi:hypothetical protein
MDATPPYLWLIRSILLRVRWRIEEKEEEDASDSPRPRPGAPKGVLPLLPYPTGLMMNSFCKGLNPKSFC